jgi:glutaredoxin-related protein
VPEDEASLRKAARERIEGLVKENKLVLFMKGSKMFPMCGFSNTAVQVLRAVEAEFETFDVLSGEGVLEPPLLALIFAGHQPSLPL